MNAEARETRLTDINRQLQDLIPQHQQTTHTIERLEQERSQLQGARWDVS